MHKKDIEGTVHGSSGERGGMPGPMATSHLRFVGYGPPEARSSPASKPTTYACRISTVKPSRYNERLFIWLEATVKRALCTGTNAVTGGTRVKPSHTVKGASYGKMPQ